MCVAVMAITPAARSAFGQRVMAASFLAGADCAACACQGPDLIASLPDGIAADVYRDAVQPRCERLIRIERARIIWRLDCSGHSGHNVHMEYPEPKADRALAVAEAKAVFADCLRHAERGEPVVVTRHGKAVAAIVSVDDYRALARLKSAGPQGGLASLAGGWTGSDALVTATLSTRRSGPRKPPGLR